MRKLMLGVVCLACLFVLAGCGKPQPPAQLEAAGGPAKLTVAVIPKCTTSQFWETVEEGANDAAGKLGVEIRWEGPLAETELAEQNKIIENMISLGVDGIALAPLNPKAMQKTVESAVAAGIPVVIFDSAVDGDAHSSFVASDNVAGGRLAAEHMAELLGSKKDARLVVFRYVQGTASTEARAEGFIDTVKAAGMQVLADPYPEDGSVAGCKKTAGNSLERFIHDNRLDLDGIFSCNDRSSMGTIAALDDIRKSGVAVDVKCIGFDFPPKLVDALKAGDLDALMAQDPRGMGYIAVETLVKHLRGEEVPEFVDTGVRLVTIKRLKGDAALRKLVGME
jgi:ribose transport system substrate-binding protein